MKKLLFALGLAVLSFQVALSVPAEPTEAEMAALKKAFAELRPQQGVVVLKGGLATLNVPQGLQYLDPKDAQTILVKIWGNPPEAASGVLGMLVESPKSAVSAGGWGVVITYSEDGHIDDKDALKTDYAALLQTMKQGMGEANKERVKKGYPTVDIAGWAEPPHYDPSTHKIYWAKELAFSGQDRHTLNYCIRVLGRRGVLELNAVAPMTALAPIREKTQRVIAAVDFNSGNRYADFNQSTDKLATYGIAALVAGGVAGKMGLFKVLIGVLIAAKKFVLIGIVALSAGIKKWFKRKADREQLPKS